MTELPFVVNNLHNQQLAQCMVLSCQLRQGRLLWRVHHVHKQQPAQWVVLSCHL